MTDIAFFLVDLGGGGAEKVILSLANGFAQAGLKVDLVLVKLEGDYLASISPAIRVINLDRQRLTSSLPPLVKYLQQNRPTVLLSALEDQNTLAIIASQVANVGTRTILSIHNPLPASNSPASTGWKERLRPWFIRWFYPLAHGIVAVSQGVAQDAARVSGLPLATIQVVHNPIFTPELVAKFDQLLDHPWFEENQPPVILGVGRLSKEKDFPTLIRAFALVRQQYPSRLMILGQGEEMADLQNLVRTLNLSKDVDFQGFVANPYMYMARSKLLVLSSIYEGFGNVLVEAMLAGTPVVSTDCVGTSEILADGKYGSLVSVGNVADLAAAMVATLKNPIDADVLRTRGEEFSLEAALSSYQKIF